MEGYRFIDENGTFTIQNPENNNYLYFPIAGEAGIKSCLTPNLGGDSKGSHNQFILEPVSAENLHNNKSTRNFWCQVDGKGSWSATGASSEQMAEKFTSMQDESEITAGFMWHELKRSSKKYELKSTVTSFIPIQENIEMMLVTITNAGQTDVKFTPTAAIPIYGRSADNIRDHRHVTSLLHRIETNNFGVFVTPTLSFDERGHHKNDVTYFVCGTSEAGDRPVEFFPITEDFLGEGGNFEHPLSVIRNQKGVKAGYHGEGFEAIGGIRFAQAMLKPQESISYQLLIGYTTDKNEIEDLINKYSQKTAVIDELNSVRDYWRKKVNVAIKTGDGGFDCFMQWVTFQPMLRRIFGCSFLPHHDYGKGGRGWRDLWQDCLALLIMNPKGIRQMLLDNFGGVRIDGTNATIIGSRQGEFIADRNNIARVWMDHGVWPFLTVKLYVNQTGDIEILDKEVPYFKDSQVMRGTAKDGIPDEDTLLRDKKGEIYYGTVLEHLLLQNLTAFYEVGEHNEIRLRSADWNDALDMAPERGESVAFTNAYAGNLEELAGMIEDYGKITGKDSISVAKEMEAFFTDTSDTYSSVIDKTKLLDTYCKSCLHEVSGNKVSIEIISAVRNLKQKADWMKQNIRDNEWITDKSGHSWYNGYYDNSGRRVEGQFETGVRMMLTGQVFSIMAGTATDEQMKEITDSADLYLYDENVGGYRLNTNFGELKTDLGRMFGFAYGHKENGAVFSHMAVMYANALYQRGFAKEGYKVIKALADQSIDFEKSRIYPGIPEYFNQKGRGMYHYLTGAASWYLITVIMQVFGARGEYGDLLIEPKLLAEQFDAVGKAEIKLIFRGKKFIVVYRNEDRKSFGEYLITNAELDGLSVKSDSCRCRILAKTIDALEEDTEHCILIELK